MALAGGRGGLFTCLQCLSTRPQTRECGSLERLRTGYALNTEELDRMPPPQPSRPTQVR